MFAARPRLFFFFWALMMLFQIRLHAQLCTGSLGDPVVNITFGAGQNPGPQLNTTTYNYLTTDCPFDGQYAIRNSTGGCFTSTWHQLNQDHTGDPNGYFMLVNASTNPGDFYVTTVKGLCGNTTYEFATWVVNILAPFACNGSGNKPNLTFSIETTGGNRLASVNSGDIEVANAPVWKQYGLFFTTPPNVGDLVVRITNNAPGGCGNDLALDDITFRPCGANINASVDGLTGTELNICEGISTSKRFVASVSNAFNNPEVLWQESKDGGNTWNNLAGATNLSFQWTAGPSGNFQYRLAVAEKGNINNATCRVSSNVIKVNVRPKPKVAIAALSHACEDRPLQLKISTDGYDPEKATIEWVTPLNNDFTKSYQQQGNEIIQNLSKPFIRLTDSGWYVMKITNEYGCTRMDSTRLSVYHKPNADIAVLDPTCIGKPVTLKSIASVNNSTIAGYSWSWGNGQSAQSIDIAPTFATAGLHMVSLSVKAQSGCTSDTLVRQFLVHDFPKPSFTMPEVCLSDPYAEFANTTSETGAGALIYKWTFGDPANPDFAATERSPRYKYRVLGNYPVSLEVTGEGGCRADTTQVFTINGTVPQANFELDAIPVRCAAQPVILRNTSAVDFGAITRIAIYWKNDASPEAITIDENPTSGKEYRFNYKPFVSGETSRFTIRMVAYSGTLCLSEKLQEITIHKSPEVGFDALPGVCQDAAAFLLTQGKESTGIAGAGIYTGLGVAANGTFSPSLAGFGNIALQYRYTSAAGCSDTATQVQTVWPMPKVNAGHDRVVISGGAITLDASAEGRGLSYQWTPATALNDATKLQPVAMPENDVVYLLTVTSDQGCTARDEVQVKVVPDIFVPNAFTPNGDGLNDTWQVPFLESFTNAEVRVFNRYGQQVFYTVGNARKWDGKLNGIALPMGAYVYLIDLKGGKVLKGTIMLIR